MVKQTIKKVFLVVMLETPSADQLKFQLCEEDVRPSYEIDDALCLIDTSQ